ncbi:MAG TPA: DUF1559 domain-containing protein [Gemmatales bacterium]|nr:DUF1559 domain-containing protein [Gemmatales bacterium]
MTRASRAGFSLADLLVVVGLISLLITMSLPAIQRVRAMADRVRCENRLRQIGIAIHHFDVDYGSLPYLERPPGPLTVESLTHPRIALHWMVHLLPYVERAPLWNQALQGLASGAFAWRNPPHAGLATVIPLYTCPADGRMSAAMRDADGIVAAYTSFAGVAGAYLHANGMFGQRGLRLTDALDGTSTTLLVGERPPPDTLQAGKWYIWQVGYQSTWGYNNLGPELVFARGSSHDDPSGNCFRGPLPFKATTLWDPCGRYHFWSLHSGGANFLFVDGHVQFLRYHDDPILPALATRNGGEVVELPD